MSLTSFMNISDVKGMFKREFKKPTFKITKPIVAPPQTRRYGQVGTAYDYLLRFCLKRKYRFAVENEWIAKKALLSPVILRPLSSQVIIHIDKNDNISRKVKKATLTISPHWQAHPRSVDSCRRLSQKGQNNIGPPHCSMIPSAYSIRYDEDHTKHDQESVNVLKYIYRDAGGGLGVTAVRDCTSCAVVSRWSKEDKNESP